MVLSFFIRILGIVVVGCELRNLLGRTEHAFVNNSEMRKTCILLFSSIHSAVQCKQMLTRGFLSLSTVAAVTFAFDRFVFYIYYKCKKGWEV